MKSISQYFGSGQRSSATMRSSRSPTSRTASIAGMTWSRQIGAKLEDGLREGPSWIAFARDNGHVYHTYTVMAPDQFVAPYHSFLLDRTPKTPPEEMSTLRKDEYPD